MTTLVAKKDTTPDIRCGHCNWEVPASLVVFVAPNTVALDGEGIRAELDYFGDGKTHPAADFPAPSPFTIYGARWTSKRTGEVVHACGTFGTP
jgi:hypothetical protein